jgi:hypothetical protein
MINSIKKVNNRIYEFDFSKTDLIDGNEIIVNNKVSEFVMAFRRRDLDKGIIVTPSGYTKGLVYKSSNGGEIYNNPMWVPDVVTFALNVYGLKKGCFYKLTVISRDTGTNNIITSDRSLFVTNEEKESIIDVNVKGEPELKEYYGIFRSNDNEANLFFSIGKIYVSNIIIDEVEMISEEKSDLDSPENKIEEGKIQVAAYGVFNLEPIVESSFKGRYVPLTKYTGKGINLYFDKNTQQYVIERDNVNDVLGESFTNLNYLVDINTSKVVSKGLFDRVDVVEVNIDISPNTIKQGFIRFELIGKDGTAMKYKHKDGRLSIIISKIY